MDINTLKIGEIYTNDNLQKTFAVGNSGGMRYSKKNDVLLIIADHTKGYEDVWDGNDVILYTGMGLKGDQSLDYKQNKRLLNSNKLDVKVLLFEVFNHNQYLYQGEVKLIRKPLEAIQADETGHFRKVYLFPLQLQNSKRIIPEGSIFLNERVLAKSSLKYLKEITLIKKELKTCFGLVRQFIRNDALSELTKMIANGSCQLCNNNAPFYIEGKPYLESHHVKWLSKGGEDDINNMVALCPNCHKKMHYLDLKEDRKKLLDIASMNEKQFNIM